MFVYLLKSWVIGLAIAAPVGPIGLLSIRKTLELGIAGSLAVGLGAALADSVYGTVAALGLAALSNFLLTQANYIKIFGGLFLLYIAYKEIKGSYNPDADPVVKNKHSARLVVEVFLLTLTNPMTILSFIGVFASISNGPSSALESLVMVAGIFIGSMTWWLVLGGTVLKIKHKLPEIWINHIKTFSSIILGGFGIVAIASGLFAVYK